VRPFSIGIPPFGVINLLRAVGCLKLVNLSDENVSFAGWGDSEWEPEDTGKSLVTFDSCDFKAAHLAYLSSGLAAGGVFKTPPKHPAVLHSAPREIAAREDNC
jgi:hypothetical protein